MYIYLFDLLALFCSGPMLLSTTLMEMAQKHYISPIPTSASSGSFKY